MENINAKINTQIDEAIENVRSQICETYGADPDVDDADEINNDLHEFVTEVMDEAFKSVRDIIKQELFNIAKPGTIASLEAKIDALLARGEHNNIQQPRPNPIELMRVSNNASQWSRYQKAWYKWMRNNGESVPVHAGERSKLCATNYKEFKTKSANEREDFLNEWA